MTSAKQKWGISAAILAGIAYGSYGIWTRFAGEAMGPFQIAWFRSIPVIILLAYIIPKRKALKRIERRDFLWLGVYMFGGQLSTHPFTLAVLAPEITLGEVLFLFYASSIVVSFVMAFLLYRERLTLTKALGVLLAFCGLLLLYRVGFTPAKTFGIVMALVAGVGFALYSTSTKKISGQYSSELLNLLNYLPFLITAPLFMFLTQEKVTVEIESIFWVSVYGLIALGAGYVVIAAFKYIEAQKASLILLLEPVVAAVFGVLLFSEELSAQFWLAAFLIICGAALPNLSFKFKRAQPQT